MENPIQIGVELKLLEVSHLFPGREIHKSGILLLRNDARFSFCYMFVILCVLREHKSLTHCASHFESEIFAPVQLEA